MLLGPRRTMLSTYFAEPKPGERLRPVQQHMQANPELRDPLLDVTAAGLDMPESRLVVTSCAKHHAFNKVKGGGG